MLPALNSMQSGSIITGFTEPVEQPFFTLKGLKWWKDEGVESRVQQMAEKQAHDDGRKRSRFDPGAQPDGHEKMRIGDPRLRLTTEDLHDMGEFAEKVKHGLWLAREAGDSSLLHSLGFSGITEAEQTFKQLGRRGRMPWGHDFYRERLPYICSDTFVLTPPAHMILPGLMKDLISFAVGKFPGWTTAEKAATCPLMFSKATMDKFKVSINHNLSCTIFNRQD